MSLQELPATHCAPEPVRESSRTVTGVRWVGRLLAWSVILAGLAAITVAVLVPRLGGATPYEVLTGSMKPGLPPGTLVVMKPVTDPSKIGVGSVVTYQLNSGLPTVVTHRIVEVQNTLDGEVRYLTQGDANSVPDAEWVRPEQIRGSLWYAVPHIGRANDLITGEQRHLGVIGAAILLLGYALGMFIQAARGMKQER